jgi:predicted PurR-regulated permease PerM
MPDKAPSQTRRARLWRSTESQGIPLRAILVTVAVVVVTFMAGKLLYRLRDVVLLVAVSGFVALLLNPLVVYLQRWKVPRRGFAVAIVTFWAVLVFVGLAIAFGYPLIRSGTHLADQLPSYVDQAQHGRGWIGQLIRRYHVTTWVQHNSAKIASFAQSLGKPALALGKGAVSLLVALGTIFFLVLLLLLEGPKMRSWILANMTSERAVRVTRVSAQVNRAVTGYMAGNMLTSVIAGTVVFVTLLLLGVPFPFLWALWVALVDFLPMIGGALAGIPTVLFATAHSLTAGIVTLAVFLAYTQIENHVLNPVVMSKTVQINPLLVLISILVAASIGSWIGGLFGGFVAALLAIPAAGAGQVIVSELWRDTAPSAPAGSPGPAGPPGPGAGAVASAGAGTAPAEAGAGVAPAEAGAGAGVAPAEAGAGAGVAPGGAGVAPGGAGAGTAGAGVAPTAQADPGTAARGPAGADVAGDGTASVTKPAT